MSWALDTNILKHFTQPGTIQHEECVRMVQSLWASGERLTTFAQCIIEFWGFLTRPSLTDNAALINPGLGLSLEEAKLELYRVESLFGVHRDTAVLYDEWRRIVLLYQVRGKQVHDAHIAAAAHMHGVTHLLTYNVDDFKRYNEFFIAVAPREITKPEKSGS